MPAHARGGVAVSPATAVTVLAALVLGAVALGEVLRRRGGRARAVRGAEAVDFTELGVAAPGRTGTVVQFSTEYCARCPGTRRLVAELVGESPHVAFAHVDVTHAPQLARKYQLLQTPTLLFIDGTGTPHTRVSGVLSRATIERELAALTGGTT
nr:thioredoxin family protein [Leucobacter luti]